MENPQSLDTAIETAGNPADTVSNQADGITGGQVITNPPMNIYVGAEEEEKGDPFGSLELPTAPDPDEVEYNNLVQAAMSSKPDADEGIEQPKKEAQVPDILTTVPKLPFSAYSEKVEETVGEGSAATSQAIRGGILDAAQGILNTVHDISAFVTNQFGIDYPKERYTFAGEIEPRSASTVTNFMRDMVKFTSLYATSSAATGGFKLGMIGKDMLNGALADFVGTDPREEHVAELIRKNPSLQRGAAYAMAAGETDNQVMYEKSLALLEGATIDMGLRMGATGVKKMVTMMADIFKGYGVANVVKKATSFETGLMTKEVNPSELPPPIPEELTKETADFVKIMRGDKVDLARPQDLNMHTFSSADKAQKVYDALIRSHLEKVINVKGNKTKAGEIINNAADYLKGVQKRATKEGVSEFDIISKELGTDISVERNLVIKSMAESAFVTLDKAMDMVNAGKMGWTAFGAVKDQSLNVLTALSKAEKISGLSVKVFDDEFVRMGVDLDSVGLTAAEAVRATKEIAGEAIETGASGVGGGARRSAPIAGRKLTIKDKIALLQRLDQDYGENVESFGKAYTKARKAAGENTQGLLAALTRKTGDVLENLVHFMNAQMLTGVKTHARNIISTTAETGSNVVDTMFAESLSALQGFPVESVQRGETLAQVRGSFDGLDPVMRNAWHNLRNIKNKSEWKPIFDKDLSPEFTKTAVAVGDTAQKANPSNTREALSTTGNVIKYALSGRVGVDALNVEDQIFKSINYHGALRARAVRMGRNRGFAGKELRDFVDATISGDIPDELHNYAIEAARKNTYTAAREGLFKDLEKLVHHPNLGFMGKLLFPFVGTNMNVLERTISRTPFLAYTVKANRTARAAGGAEAQGVLARQLTGLTFMGLASLAVHESDIDIVGSIPFTKGKYGIATGAGLRPNSVIMGDEVIPLQTLGPAGSIIGLMADIDHLSRVASTEEDFSMIDGIAKVSALALMDYHTPEFVMDTVGSILDATAKRSLEPLKRIVTSRPASIIPYSALLRQINAPSVAVDVRHADSWGSEALAEMQKVIAPEGLQNWMGEMTKDFISLRAPEGLPPLRDVWGDPVKSAEGVLQVRELSDDPVKLEGLRLARLGQISGEDKRGMSLIMNKPDAKGTQKDSKTGYVRKYALNMNEYDRLFRWTTGQAEWMQDKGIPTMKEALLNVIKSDKYKDAVYQEQRMMYQTIVEAYRRAGTQAFHNTGENAQEYRDDMNKYLQANFPEE